MFRSFKTGNALFHEHWEIKSSIFLSVHFSVHFFFIPESFPKQISWFSINTYVLFNQDREQTPFLSPPPSLWRWGLSWQASVQIRWVFSPVFLIWTHNSNVLVHISLFSSVLDSVAVNCPEFLSCGFCACDPVTWWSLDIGWFNALLTWRNWIEFIALG